MRTLVLDLDETLVHSSLEEAVGRPDFSFTVTFNGRDHAVQARTLGSGVLVQGFGFRAGAWVFS